MVVSKGVLTGRKTPSYLLLQSKDFLEQVQRPQKVKMNEKVPQQTSAAVERESIVRVVRLSPQISAIVSTFIDCSLKQVLALKMCTRVSDRVLDLALLLVCCDLGSIHF